MNEREIMLKFKECYNRMNGSGDDIGIEPDEDGPCFFRDGYFNVVIRDGRICQTTFRAEDFDAIKYKTETDYREGWVVIYFKDGTRLYYYDPESYPANTDWLLNPPGGGERTGSKLDREFVEYFDVLKIIKD